MFCSWNYKLSESTHHNSTDVESHVKVSSREVKLAEHVRYAVDDEDINDADHQHHEGRCQVENIPEVTEVTSRSDVEKPFHVSKQGKSERRPEHYQGYSHPWLLKRYG